MTNKLPNRMRVDSPEIDSINRTTQRISNWMHKDFVDIARPLQVLPSLPGVLKDLQERLVEQFRINFSGQVAIEMKAREANVIMAERKSQFLEEQINRKNGLLAEYSERINSRYSRISDETAKEHESFLTQIDSHAYRIVEEIYPDQIQAKFSDRPDVTLSHLVTHAMEASVARAACLAESRDETSDIMAEFLAERQASYGEIDGMVSGLQEGSFEIPYHYAIFEDHETGEEILEIVFGEEDGRSPFDSELRSRLMVAIDEASDSLPRAELPPEVLKQVEEVVRKELDVPREQLSRFKRDHASIAS